MKDITVKEYIQSVIKTTQEDKLVSVLLNKSAADVILNITAKGVHPSSIQINLTKHVHSDFSLNKLLRWKGEPIGIQNIRAHKNFWIDTLVVKSYDYIQTKNQLEPAHQDLSINPEALRTGADPFPVPGSQRKFFSLEEISLIKKIESSSLDEKKENKSPTTLPSNYNPNYFLQPKKPLPNDFSAKLSGKLEIQEDYLQTPEPTDSSSDEEDYLERYMNACTSDR